MTMPGLNWRNAKLPPKTAVFAIGDIHAHYDLLGPMLAAIEDKISKLPPDVQAHVVFIGDYLDRGPSTPATIDMILDFERRMKSNPRVETHFLCGNHDEYFHRLLEAPKFTDHVLGDPNNPSDYRHCISDTDGSLSIIGLEAALFSGGGLKTMRDYMPELDMAMFDIENKRFNRDYPGFGPEMVEKLVKDFASRVPQAHKDFFTRAYGNSHLILGDYLFTHAGIDPEKSLAAQGIGEGAAPLKGADYLDLLMLRNPFLWRDDDNLPNCPYVVVHGHTPSEIVDSSLGIIADGQKNYRLCLDTGVYHKNGMLTCFERYDGNASFMGTSLANPGRVHEYGIPEVGQHVAALMHERLHPEYHGKEPQTRSHPRIFARKPSGSTVAAARSGL